MIGSTGNAIVRGLGIFIPGGWGVGHKNIPSFGTYAKSALPDVPKATPIARNTGDITATLKVSKGRSLYTVYIPV